MTEEELQKCREQLWYHNVSITFGNLENGEAVRLMVISDTKIRALTEITFDLIQEIIAKHGKLKTVSDA